MKKHIFTIAAGCGPVVDVMLDSYLYHHEETINVYLFFDDIADISFIRDKRVKCHLLHENLKENFSRGHEGTAKVWAMVMKHNPDDYLIHIDSDVFFKKSALYLIEKAGYPDIYGSRRCYKNNPGKAPVPEGIEDAISTYFLGFKASFMGSLISDRVLYSNLERMVQGAYNPLGFPCLDFFDPCFFYARSQDATVYYEDPNLIGGQDKNGSKVNKYKSNLHLDMGEHLAHFGGVGSGYSVRKKVSTDGDVNLTDYEEWALQRYFFFDDLFYGKKDHSDIHSHYSKTNIDQSGRWVSGGYSSEIYNQIISDLNEFGNVNLNK